MEFPEREVALAWVGRTLVDRDGSEIGACTAVFSDDATQVTEWVCSEVGGTAVFIPAVGATESGDRVQVFVSRDDVADAPTVGGPEHITNEEEARLYRHYGIPHSREASPTLLPTGEPRPAADAATTADGATPGTARAVPEPRPAVGAADGPSAPAAGGRGRVLAAAAGLAAVGMAVGSVLGMRRLRRRRPPTRTERILARTRAVSGAVSTGTSRIAAAAPPLLETTVRRGRGAGAVVLPVAAAVALPILRRRRSRTGPDAYLNGDGREMSRITPAG